jgi:electron transport complex protein RnfG
MTVKKALKADVDGVTGATYSSDAVKENVKRGLQYYQKNK